MRKDRVLLYGSPLSYITWILLGRTLVEILRRGDMHVVGLHLNTPKKRTPPRKKADIAISLAYPHRIDVSCYVYTVNYHNSTLPNYAGVYSSSWAMYNNEEVTGYTWHRMTPEFDTGNILSQGKMPGGFRPAGLPSLVWYEIRKTWAASGQIKDVLRKAARRDCGVPQQGTRSYYGFKDFHDITRLVGTCPTEEVKRRINCFGYVELKLGGKWLKVTSISPLRVCFLPEKIGRWLS